jgi:NaMN:DMB phosphoribosyltransferase
VTALLELGTGVGRPDAEAASAARAGAGSRTGRLAELLEWLAGTQGRCPPIGPKRPRCVVLGAPSGGLPDLAASLDVGLVSLVPPTADAFAAGVAAADAEIEAGADLLALVVPDDKATTTAAVLVSLLTGAEPVALLPRGADALDTDRWIGRAAAIRDARRRLAAMRTRPDELLAAIDSPLLSMAAALVMRAAARRTAVVVDGTAAVAAALLCADVQLRARDWVQVADTNADRVHARAVEQLALRPLLALGTGRGDGTAGVLAVAILRAAVTMGSSGE